MSYIDDQDDFLFDIAQLIKFAKLEGFQVTCGEFGREPEMQLLYYYGFTIQEKDGSIELVKRSKRTKTLKSKHLVRRAADLHFFKDKVYINNLPEAEAKKLLQPLADYFKSLHPLNKWGGEFKNFFDSPHFERS